MNIELAYHSREEFISWFLSLASIDQMLVALVPIVLVIFLLAWAMHNSGNHHHRVELGESPRTALTPILLLVLMFVGGLWLLSPFASSNRSAKSDPLPLPTQASQTPYPQPIPPVTFVQPPADECANCSGPAIAHGAEFSVMRADDSHFYVPGTVNGVSVTFQVDTGATVTSLPLWMAGSVGVRTAQVIYTNTANGISSGFSSSGLNIDLVNEWHDYADVYFLPGLANPLLGQNVLSRFDIETKGDRLYFHGH